MSAVWRPKPSSCADVATFVSSGCNLDEKSSTDDLGETPSPVSPSSSDGPDLPLQVQHKDQSCSLVNCPDSAVDSRYPPSNSTVPITSPVEVPGFIADENLVAENDDVNSQSSEEWTTKVIANDPMHYAFRCLLGENDSQSFFNSVTKDQRGLLFNFIDSCWILFCSFLGPGADELNLLPANELIAAWRDVADGERLFIDVLGPLLVQFWFFVVGLS
ncbi:hypothetical protein Nepgr_020400 [Nepenthes gracilis]|uniref:Uncharacterized protein n=1 Tax=Nepenthes gracilis TaxID=150966 RepID=A0AAD3SXJ8_NEPGR|nr:hypothetical protein Nepgr_020400 [Nepenthes gracilis]